MYEQRLAENPEASRRAHDWGLEQRAPEPLMEITGPLAEQIIEAIERPETRVKRGRPRRADQCLVCHARPRRPGSSLCDVCFDDE